MHSLVILSCINRNIGHSQLFSIASAKIAIQFPFSRTKSYRYKKKREIQHDCQLISFNILSGIV